MAFEQTMNFDKTMNQTVDQAVTVNIENTLVEDDNMDLGEGMTKKFIAAEDTFPVQQTRIQVFFFNCSDLGLNFDFSMSLKVISKVQSRALRTAYNL